MEQQKYGFSRVGSFVNRECWHWLLPFSILLKEILYQYTVRVGKRCDSQAVVANAWHHRSDALSSIGTTVGIGGAILLGPHWAYLILLPL